MRYTPIKRILSLISLLILLLGISACTPAENYNDIHNLSLGVVAKTEFSELKELSGADLVSYFGFQDSTVKRFCVKVSANGQSADTVACFEVTSDEKQAIVITGISQYLNKLTSSFKTTMESEYRKVQQRLLFKLDNTIILVVCGDYTPVTEHLTTLGAKPIY